MFVREKRIGPYTYIYLVETVREGGHVKQRIIRNLGRKEEVERRGDLDRLVLSATRLAQRSMVLSLLEQGTLPDLACHRIGLQTFVDIKRCFKVLLGCRQIAYHMGQHTEIA